MLKKRKERDREIDRNEIRDLERVSKKESDVKERVSEKESR